MKRLTQIDPFCTVMTMAWLLGACASTSTAPAVDPSPVGLSATLKAPDSLPNGEKVKLQFTLTNHSPERLYVLTWYTPLEGIFGEIFRVARSGQPIPYEGPLVMRGDPLPENYVLLEPGASVSAEVDLATAYDFFQAGEYTIEFLSTKISHVAKTEREFAMSVDDLGPVEISCNSLHLEIAGPSASSTRRTRAEGAEIIHGYSQCQHSQLNPDVRLPLEELATLEAWEGLRVQLFRITEGPFVHESCLIKGDRVLGIGEATGGGGLIWRSVTWRRTAPPNPSSPMPLGPASINRGSACTRLPMGQTGPRKPTPGTWTI
jgi:hypothetical protein